MHNIVKGALKKSIIILSMFCQLHVYCQPVIVILMGSGSAGKTSIGRELQAKDSSWTIIDEDDVYIELFLEKIKARFPTEFATIAQAILPENRFHAIKKMNYILVHLQILHYNLKQKLL